MHGGDRCGALASGRGFALTLLPLVLGLAIAQGNAQNPFDGVVTRQDILVNHDGSKPRLMMQQPQASLPSVHRDPKKVVAHGQPFVFDWITWGFVKPYMSSDQFNLRFMVYSQDRNPADDKALAVTQMLLRLWDLNHERMGLDHSEKSYRQLINVYLTYGGDAGGEQFFGPDTEGTQRVPANNIFIYDIPSFKEPVEMAREIAHEYGHATLPPVGVYQAPEDWANGYFGEKLYLSWIRNLLATKALEPADFMGVTAPELDKWLATNVEPAVTRAATSVPSMGQLADRSAKGMDAFTGLGTYMGLILPGPVFGRSLKLIGSQNARDYPNAVLMAIEEPESVTLSFPEYLQGKAVWVPLAKGKLSGAKPLKFESGWAQIVAGSTPVLITGAQPKG